MNVSFFDLRVSDTLLRNELLKSVEDVLNHGRILFGPEVSEFEKKVAKEAGVKYAVGLSCGSSALYLALRCLDIGPGDEVITTPLTWIITGNAIVECGATPVFVDIKDDFNIDPDEIEKAITKKTKAIIPVHFTGLMCEMDRIAEIAKLHNLFVIEDAAQAITTKYKDKYLGSYGDLATFSFHETKNIISGEGGLLAINNPIFFKCAEIIWEKGTNRA